MKCSDLNRMQFATQSILQVIVFSANDLKDVKDDDEILDKLVDLCQSDSVKISKFAARSVVKIAGPDSHEIKSIVRSAFAALEHNSRLPGVLAALSEVVKAAPKLLKSAEQATLINFAKKLLHQAWSGNGKKDKKLILIAKSNALKLLAAFVLGCVNQDVNKERQRAEDLLSELSEVLSKHGNIGVDAMTDADKSMLRLTVGSCVLKIAKIKEVRDLVTPKLFLLVSLLCEDEDISVRKAIVTKIWKGAGLQQGRLPFHFAARVVLGAHDPEPAQLDYVKTIMKNLLGLMKKLRSNSGKLLISIAPERILPWLVYILANHPKYLDADEDDAQVSVAFKKYLDLYFNALTQTGTDEKIFPMLWQALDHIRCCHVPEQALTEDGAAVVPRNIGIICEVGKRLVTKFGGQKKWDSEVLRDHLSKVVDSSIFLRRAEGAQSYTPRIPDSIGLLSPPRKGGSAQSTPASTAQKPQKLVQTEKNHSPASQNRLVVDQASASDTIHDSGADGTTERNMPKRGAKTAMRSLQEVSEVSEDEPEINEKKRRKGGSSLTSALQPGKNRQSNTSHQSVDDVVGFYYFYLLICRLLLLLFIDLSADSNI